VQVLENLERCPQISHPRARRLWRTLHVVCIICSKAYNLYLYNTSYPCLDWSISCCRQDWKIKKYLLVAAILLFYIICKALPQKIAYFSKIISFPGVTVCRLCHVLLVSFCPQEIYLLISDFLKLSFRISFTEL